MKIEKTAPEKAHESLLIADSILEGAAIRRLHTSELEILKKHLKLMHRYFDLETNNEQLEINGGVK